MKRDLTENLIKRNLMARNLTAVCLAMACMLLCCGCKDKGGTILIGSSENQAQESFSQEESASAVEPPSETECPETLIRVYVCGAVTNPGVVEIPQGSRVEDALAAAGGFGTDAGREAVNLADWVSDGQKIYFPTEEEAEEAGVSGTGTDTASPGLVNINTADVAALCSLSGIGESRAQDIIAYREANGGFASCEDIMNVPGIKSAVYEKIKDKITVK